MKTLTRNLWRIRAHTKLEGRKHNKHKKLTLKKKEKGELNNLKEKCTSIYVDEHFFYR